MFQGHNINSLVIDFCLGMTVFFFVVLIYAAIRSKKRIVEIALWVIYILQTPNAAYLFLEGKHLLLKDGIAEPVNLNSIIVFGGLSLLGLFSMVFCQVLTVQLIPYFRTHKKFWIIVLSFQNATGAVLGLMDLNSYDALIKPLDVLKTLYHVLTTFHWDIFIIFLACIFASLSIFINYFVQFPLRILREK